MICVCGVVRVQFHQTTTRGAVALHFIGCLCSTNSSHDSTRSSEIPDYLFLTHQVTKRDEDSSLMQLKEEFRTYEALRREHDAQIVHIAMEAGLRISPEQWSSLLYGDLVHKSHMQSIIDKVSAPSCS